MDGAAAGTEGIQMLHISVKVGEYFTIGDDAVIQFDKLSGERAGITIHAPREIPIVRGAVLEREGGRRPSCVTETAPRHVTRLPLTTGKKKALREIEETLARMGDSPETALLRQKLDYIFSSRT